MAPKTKRKVKRKRTAAREVRAVAIEGLAAEHEHASDMGIYKHTGREVNGCGVWASVGHHEAYIYYSEMGSWCVSDATDMAAGAHQGSLMVESEAETPHAITESWSVHDSENWSADAPGVRVRLASDAEVLAAVQHVEWVQSQALAAAQRARQVVVGGVPAGEEYDDSMGSYALVDGVTVNGRCVWQLDATDKERSESAGEAEDDAARGVVGEEGSEDGEEDEEIFLYYASTCAWYISYRGSMEAGAPHGWLRCQSEAPDGTLDYTPGRSASR